MNGAGEAMTEETTGLWEAPEGTRVLGVDGGKLGEVVAVYRDRLIVERGFFFPTDFYVPFAAVGEYAGGTIRLIVSLREALEFGWEAPPIDEPTPIVAAETPIGAPTPSVPAPAAARTEAATSTAPSPGEPAPPRVPARPPIVAELPPAALSAAETSDRTAPHVPAPAASNQAEPATVALAASAPEGPSPAEAAADPESAAMPVHPPAADRPKPASPVLGAAGGSYLSRLFPDLVGQAEDSPMSTEPAAVDPAPTTTGRPDPAGAPEPAVDAPPAPTEPAATTPAPAAPAAGPEVPSPAANAGGDTPKASTVERTEQRGDPPKE